MTESGDTDPDARTGDPRGRRHRFARDPSAALGEVAAAAGVGRTTLHRYFPERSDLLSALVVHVLEQVAAAMERAAPTHGPAPAALGRAAASTSNWATS